MKIYKFLSKEWIFLSLISILYLLIFFSAGAAFFLAAWIRNRKLSYLFLFGLLAGIGLWTKIIFIWFIIGLILSYPYIRNNIVISKKEFIVLAGAFLSGIFPMLFYNIATGFKTIKIIFASWGNPVALQFGSGGVIIDNKDIFHNIAVRLEQFYGLYGKSMFDVFEPSRGLNIVNVFQVYFTCAFVLLLLFSVIQKDIILRKKIFFTFTMFLAIFIGTTFTVSCFRTMHLVFVMPFPQIIEALFAYYAVKYLAAVFKDKYLLLLRLLQGIIITGFLLVVIVDVKIIKWCRSNDFVPLFYEDSSAVYPLTEYLVKNNITEPYIIDKEWFIIRKSWFLSQGKISGHDLFSPGTAEVERTPEEFSVLTFASPIDYVDPESSNIYQRWDKLKNNYNVVDVKKFADRSGRNIYILYKIKGTLKPC
jgi:hypothetical protein